ncbi:hypothetical protein OC835_000184 [Tilletia horrida]|nr:hypothetical protein OC835_000184 [Tilletia horrida]
MPATTSTEPGLEGGGLKHSLTLTLPFPDERSASIVRDVLQVDRQLRPKEVTVIYSVEGSDVVVKIDTTTVKQLRLSVNAVLENASLVTKTIEAFSGPPSTSQSQPSTS